MQFVRKGRSEVYGNSRRHVVWQLKATRQIVCYILNNLRLVIMTIFLLTVLVYKDIRLIRPVGPSYSSSSWSRCDLAFSSQQTRLSWCFKTRYDLYFALYAV